MRVTWDSVYAVAPAFVTGEDGEDAELGAHYELACAEFMKKSGYIVIKETSGCLLSYG